MTPPRRTIVVFGATGNQGGSVARALIEDGNFNVVAITRDPTSSKAKDLAALGAKLVKGDLDDPSTYEPALKGVDGAFLTTDYWQHYDGTNANTAMAREVTQGKAAADALARAKVPHVVFSTLASYRPRQDLPHFDGKADITAYLAELNVPTTNLFLSYYYSNIFMLGGTEKPDGTLVLNNPLPDGVGIPSFAVEETGQWALAAFRDPATWIGKSMDACTGYITVEEYAAGVAKATGRKVETQKWTRGQFLADKDVDREWWLNWYAIVHGEMQYDVEASKKVVPHATRWTEWVEKHPKVKEVFGKK